MRIALLCVVVVGTLAFGFSGACYSQSPTPSFKRQCKELYLGPANRTRPISNIPVAITTEICAEVVSSTPQLDIRATASMSFNEIRSTESGLLAWLNKNYSTSCGINNNEDATGFDGLEITGTSPHSAAAVQVDGWAYDCSVGRLPTAYFSITFPIIVRSEWVIFVQLGTPIVLLKHGLARALDMTIFDIRSKIEKRANAAVVQMNSKPVFVPEELISANNIVLKSVDVNRIGKALVTQVRVVAQVRARQLNATLAAYLENGLDNPAQ